ncbi:MAG TPA: substrate-binding domain-containing protein [Stellaceae bacterium]
MRLGFAAVVVAACVTLVAGRAGANETIVLASTTSVENSGLLARILPEFTNKAGISVRVLAQGTGQALTTAARGDADLVLVHDPEAEQQFIAEGHGAKRRQIAWNDFIVVGPRADPAHIAGGHDAVAAFTAIAEARAPFVSRGDKSGTDALEHRLWRAAEIDPTKTGGGSWYRDIGGGMGAALNTAAAMSAYTLSDRGTWQFRQQARPRGARPSRSAAAEPVRRDPARSEEAPGSQAGARPPLGRLARLARGASRDRGV